MLLSGRTAGPEAGGQELPGRSAQMKRLLDDRRRSVAQFTSQSHSRSKVGLVPLPYAHDSGHNPDLV